MVREGDHPLELVPRFWIGAHRDESKLVAVVQHVDLCGQTRAPGSVSALPCMGFCPGQGIGKKKAVEEGGGGWGL